MSSRDNRHVEDGMGFAGLVSPEEGYVNEIEKRLARCIEKLNEERTEHEITRRKLAIARAALRDAENRLRGAGMLGGADDQVSSQGEKS